MKKRTQKEKKKLPATRNFTSKIWEKQVKENLGKKLRAVEQYQPSYLVHLSAISFTHTLGISFTSSWQPWWETFIYEKSLSMLPSPFILALRRIWGFFDNFIPTFVLDLMHLNLQSLTLQAAIVNSPIHWVSKMPVTCLYWGEAMWCSTE